MYPQRPFFGDYGAKNGSSHFWIVFSTLAEGKKTQSNSSNYRIHATISWATGMQKTIFSTIGIHKPKFQTTGIHATIVRTVVIHDMMFRTTGTLKTILQDTGVPETIFPATGICETCLPCALCLGVTKAATAEPVRKTKINFSDLWDSKTNFSSQWH